MPCTNLDRGAGRPPHKGAGCELSLPVISCVAGLGDSAGWTRNRAAPEQGGRPGREHAGAQQTRALRIALKLRGGARRWRQDGPWGASLMAGDSVFDRDFHAVRASPLRLPPEDAQTVVVERRKAVHSPQEDQQYLSSARQQSVVCKHRIHVTGNESDTRNDLSNP